MRKEGIAVLPWDLVIILRVNEHEVKIRRVPDKGGEASNGVPGLADVLGEPLLDLGVPAERREDGNVPADAVGKDHLLHAREPSDGYHGRKFLRWVLRGEFAGYADGDGGAKGLADECDARGRDAELVDSEANGGHAVGDKAGFGRFAGGEAEAAVVDCEDVDFGGVRGREGAEVGGAVARTDGACIAVDWNMLVNVG